MIEVAVREPMKLDSRLSLVSRFGFMLELCIVAARQSQSLVCPVHSDHPLPIRDIAPDLVRVTSYMYSYSGVFACDDPFPFYRFSQISL